MVSVFNLYVIFMLFTSLTGIFILSTTMPIDQLKMTWNSDAPYVLHLESNKRKINWKEKTVTLP